MARKLTPGQQAAVQRFRSRRAELGLKQRDVADLVSPELSRRSVESFEAGKSWPHIASLQALSRAVGWHQDYLQEYAYRNEATITDANVQAMANASSDLERRAIATQAILDLRSLSTEEKLDIIRHINAAPIEATDPGQQPETEQQQTGS